MRCCNTSSQHKIGDYMYITTKYSSLLEKNDNDIINVNDLKKYLRINYDEEDELIQTLINTAYEEVENIIGKNLLPKKWKDDVEISLDKCDQDFLFEFPITINSKIHIPLTNKPVINVKSVWTNNTELDKENYDVIMSNTPVLCIKSRSLIGCAKNNKILLGITYETGMYKESKDIPSKIKLGIMMIAANKFYQRDSVAPIFSKKKHSGIKRLLAQFRDYSI